ncbi:MAG TPA: SoxR reducing system RseC family protein [Firmicutes bacterium]|nr:SoxR reducing system RseC family protein [Bacillota bacterium]
MQKEACVVAVEEDAVRVRLLRHSACAKCGACTMGENPETEVTLKHIAHLQELNLKPGDRVTLVYKANEFLRAVLLVYLVPLLLFILGYLIGARLFTLYVSARWGEGGGVLSGLLLMILSYLGLNRYDRWLARQEKYRILIKSQTPPYKE